MFMSLACCCERWCRWLQFALPHATCAQQLIYLHTHLFSDFWTTVKLNHLPDEYKRSYNA